MAFASREGIALRDAVQSGGRCFNSQCAVAQHCDVTETTVYGMKRHRRMRIPVFCALALALATCTAVASVAQQCPQSITTGLGKASEVRALEGSLVFHDSIRKWFELKLDQLQCGQTSIELMPINADWTPVEVLRGCRVRSSGKIYFSPTGYYSLDTSQAVEQVEPVGECAKQLPFRDH